jgi:alkylation response protein AidB-like acyl-CoA dehydrogenase
MTKDYLKITQELAQNFAKTAVERDRQGGNPKAERDQIRASGLLRLNIPQAYGGEGASWPTVFAISREIGKVDSSLAHVLSYHYLGVVVPYIFGSADQKAHYYSETLENNWFWGNAVNPLDRRTVLTPEGNQWRLNGIKSFCSGSHDSEMLPVTALREDTGELLILALPTQREGVQLHHDWDNMGQRQTDSGSIGFNNVLIYPEEILGRRDETKQPFGTIRACLTQLNLTQIYLGIAEGALDSAKNYTRTQTRPWLTSGVEKATDDPYLLQHYGNLWVDLQGASLLAEKAGFLLQNAWEKEWNLTFEERGQCAVSIATAKIAASKIGLAIANQMFELMGARSTSANYGFDRYWRNLRTFTLHDPIDYKIRDLGNWVLNNQYPEPNFYS